MIIPWSALVQSNSFMIADEFSIGIAFLCGERFGRKESRGKKRQIRHSVNVRSVRMYLRFGVASSASEKEWRTIKIRNRERERDERNGAKERFFGNSARCLPPRMGLYCRSSN